MPHSVYSPIITFAIIPFNMEFSNGFPYMWFTKTLTCKKDKAVIILVEFMVVLKTFACLVLENVSVSLIFKHN